MYKQRAKMPPSQRAKQFAPFDAVVGLRKALHEKEKIRTPRKQLSEEMIEEINKKLKLLEQGSVVTVVHYNSPEKQYEQLTGKFKKINATEATIQIDDKFIKFSNIYRLIVD